MNGTSLGSCSAKRSLKDLGVVTFAMAAQAEEQKGCYNAYELLRFGGGKARFGLAVLGSSAISKP